MARYVAKGLNVACRTIDGAAFIFREDNRELLKLDEVGSIIWDLLDGQRTVDQIVGACCTVFAADRDEVAAAVVEFIATLIENEVAVESDAPFEGVMASAC